MPCSSGCRSRISSATFKRPLSSAGSAAPPIDLGKFRNVLDQRMGYWEQRIPNGKHAFVHYAIAAEDVITAAFDRLKVDAESLALLGVYPVEPQSSAYPFSFPSGATPDHWHLGEPFKLTAASIFWFNFFPPQPYLFEKTFAAWARFQMVRPKERAENNQLVAADGKDRLIVHGISDMVQVNLNRFSSLAGFAHAAHDAGEETFTGDAEYLQYGMLLRKA
jgi:hypothetical protein